MSLPPLGWMDFIFLYPLLMAYVWMVGGGLFYLRFERHAPPYHQPPALDHYPGVSFIVPCYNEEAHVRETIEQLMRTAYPEFEVIAVNDGSTDGTQAILDTLLNEYPRLRVIQHAHNQGKAVALNTATLAARHDILICIDGDAWLEPHAAHWFVKHFNDSTRVGAVTGNPRIRNRSTLLGRLQVGEFSSIIGLIKRAQRIYGRLFTVSGVLAAFRRQAVHDVGYWSPGMLTEDVDISWRLQLQHWDVRFEPHAIAWILMPETFTGLWKQRLRWAMGGTQALIRFFPQALHWHTRRMWGIYLEFIASLVWAFGALLMILFWALGHLLPLPEALTVPELLPQWAGIAIGITCLVQFFLGMWLDRHYDHPQGRSFYWMIWYPTAFWMLSVFTSTLALPALLLRHLHKDVRARWESPDRGITADSSPQP